MDNISFEEDKLNIQNNQDAKRSKNLIVQSLLKVRLVENEKQAFDLIIWGTAIIIIAAILIFIWGRNPGLQNPSEELINSPQPTKSL